MKSAQINKYGSYDVFAINQNSSVPLVSEGKILVEVKAASINPFDTKVLQGTYKDTMPVNFPATLGGDFSGVVKEVGEKVMNIKVGDEVFGTASTFSGGSGSMAELALAREKNIAMRPKNISFEEAAALPLIGSSAVQALEEHLKLQSGWKLLIHGGAGGIGHIAIQLAKSLGAYVVTTVSTDDLEFVKKLGADEVIDYKKENFAEKIKDFDAVFDTVGGQVTNQSLMVVKSNGILVTMVGEPDAELAKKQKVTTIRQSTKNNSGHLNRVRQLVEENKIKVNIDQSFSLDQISMAFKYQMENHPRGKVVIKISG